MIYLIEDDRVLRDSVAEYLGHLGWQVTAFSCAEDALEASRKAAPDVAICDLNLPGMSGLELIEHLATLDESIIRIAMTAHASTRSAVRAMRAGCYEYLEKPVDLDKLHRLVKRAMEGNRERRELSWLRQSSTSPQAVEALIGESEAMQRMRDEILRFAQLDAAAPPILLQGETGVGKGLAARSLHEQRFGPEAPWISVNCSALPGPLVEAELFGHERSAFTDAKNAKAGLFEAADGGTIFLDEIGEFSLEFQAKLLTVIESRLVRRIGSLRERAVGCAIVAASNVDLREAVAAGRFRADLFHRLAGLSVHIPPLRERGHDAQLLATRFLQEFAGRYRKKLSIFDAQALAAIAHYPWPGNVRELRGVIERAVILSAADAETVEASHLGMGGKAPASEATAVTNAGSEARPAGVYAAGGHLEVQLPEDGIPFEELERAILQEALDRAEGNVSGAARLLRLNRDALRYRIRKYGLKSD